MINLTVNILIFLSEALEKQIIMSEFTFTLITLVIDLN